MLFIDAFNWTGYEEIGGLLRPCADISPYPAAMKINVSSQSSKKQ
jgi:hypothetical protein